MSITYLTWMTGLLVSMPLLLSGCASRLDYPQAWDSNTHQVLPNGCPDLSGTYSTRAVETYPENAEISPQLSEILGPGGLSEINRQQGRPWPQPVPGATTASFTSDGDDWVYVHFGDEADGGGILRFKRKHWWGGLNAESDAMFYCHQWDKGPMLSLDGSRQPDFAIPDSFYGRGVDLLSSPVTPVISLVLLSKGEDGSLVVNFRTGYVSIAHIGYLPIGAYETTLGSIWWRYPSVEPTK